MEKLLADCHDDPAAFRDPVVPFPKVPFYLPSIAVQSKDGFEKGEFLPELPYAVFPDEKGKPGAKGQHLLPHLS